MTPEDIDIAARTVWGEGRGERLDGKIAIAWVIKNRVEMDIHNDGKPDWWGEGIAAVCKKRGQFSCWLKSDPNLKKLEAVTFTDGPFQFCLLAVAAVFSGNVPDPTHGATHYKVSALAWPKDWGPKKDPLVTLGNHSFYKL